jgi:hypothetical protein
MSDYQLLTQARRKARKEHLCIHCGEKISPGIEYVYTAGAYDGSIVADHWHSECREAACEWDYDEWEYFEPYAYRRGTTRLKYEQD